GGALAAVLLGHTIDAAAILVVVVANATVGVVQEGKAEQALAAVARMLAPHAVVLRARERRQLPVRELAPGDVGLLAAGDRVPADVRLARARGVLVDEAPLTGESVAAEKAEGDGAAGAALGDRSNMAFSGTLMAAGQATGIV